MAFSPAARQDLEKQLGQWAASLDEHQLQWASGYLAGMASARAGALTEHSRGVASDVATPTVTIWYGSETGNGRGVADRPAADAATVARLRPVPDRHGRRCDIRSHTPGVLRKGPCASRGHAGEVSGGPLQLMFIQRSGPLAELLFQVLPSCRREGHIRFPVAISVYQD